MVESSIQRSEPTYIDGFSLYLSSTITDQIQRTNDGGSLSALWGGNCSDNLRGRVYFVVSFFLAGRQSNCIFSHRSSFSYLSNLKQAIPSLLCLLPVGHIEVRRIVAGEEATSLRSIAIPVLRASQDLSSSSMEVLSCRANQEHRL